MNRTFTEASRKTTRSKSKATKGVGINRPTGSQRENAAKMRARANYHKSIR